MKHILITTIAAVVLVGWGESQQSIEQVKQQSRQWSEADSALFAAADEGNTEAVKQAIAAGADINTKDESLMTPLHWAAVGGHKEVVELLIAGGADVNAKDDTGGTPLDRAIFNKDTEIGDLLRKHGAKTGEELKAEGK